MAGVPNSSPANYQLSIGPDWTILENTSAQLVIQNNATGAQYKFSAFSTLSTSVLNVGNVNYLSGAGVPASAQPKGSIYSRTDGGVGSTLYVSQGGGVWNAVAGV